MYRDRNWIETGTWWTIFFLCKTIYVLDWYCHCDYDRYHDHHYHCHCFMLLKSSVLIRQNPTKPNQILFNESAYQIFRLNVLKRTHERKIHVSRIYVQFLQCYLSNWFRRFLLLLYSTQFIRCCCCCFVGILCERVRVCVSSSLHWRQLLPPPPPSLSILLLLFLSISFSRFVKKRRVLVSFSHHLCWLDIHSWA